MDNETNLTEAQEITEEDLAAFDDDWGDENEDDGDFDLSDGDTQPETETETGAESQAEAETEKAEAEPEPETDTDAGDGEKKYTLKHLREEKTVGLEEMLTLAKKGMDYDSLKNDRDSLRTERDKLKAYEAFLNEMAEKSGSKSIEEQMTRSRAMWLKSSEAAKGNDISESEAIFQVQRQEGDTPDAEEPPNTEQEAEKVQTSMFTGFIEEFPDVKAEEIPESVWQECAKTGDLAGAYRKYENQKLKAELETMKKNQTNKDRSTGSRKSSGAATPKDPFDEAWDNF